MIIILAIPAALFVLIVIRLCQSASRNCEGGGPQPEGDCPVFRWNQEPVQITPAQRQERQAPKSAAQEADQEADQEYYLARLRAIKFGLAMRAIGALARRRQPPPWRVIK